MKDVLLALLQSSVLGQSLTSSFLFNTVFSRYTINLINRLSLSCCRILCQGFAWVLVSLLLDHNRQVHPLMDAAIEMKDASGGKWPDFCRPIFEVHGANNRCTRLYP